MSDQTVAKLANDYIKSLDSIGRPSAVKKSLAFNLMGYLPPTDISALDAINQDTNPGIGSRILDIISRPLYATANFSKAVARNITELTGETNKGTINPITAIGKGLSGEQKTTFADVIRDQSSDPFRNSTAGKIAAGVGGLSADIIADPSNLIGGGVVKGLARVTATKDAARAAMGARFGNEIVDAAKPEIAALPNNPSPIAEARQAQQNSTALNLPPSGASVLAQNAAAAPVKAPVGNLPALDTFKMGGLLQESTSQAAKRIATADSKRPKPPSYIKEVNPDAYAAALAHIVSQPADSILRASELSKSLNIGYRDATRYISMAEKDGVLNRWVPKSKGLASNSKNAAYKVVSNEVPQTSVHWQVAPNDAERAQRMASQVLPELRAKMNKLEAQGQYPQIKDSTGASYSISLPDILESIPPNDLYNLQFGAKGRGKDLYPTQWSAGAAEALRMNALGASPEDTLASVANAMRVATHPNATRINSIDAAGHIEDAARSLIGSTPNLVAKLLDNLKRFNQKDIIDARAVATTKANDVFNALQGSSTPDAINAVSSIGLDVQKSTKQIGASNDAAIAAVHDIAPAIAKVVPQTDIQFARAAKATERDRGKFGFTPQANVKAQARMYRLYQAASENADTVAAGLGLKSLTLGEKVDMSMASAMSRLREPIRSRFVFGGGTGDMGQFTRGQFSRAAETATEYRRAMSKDFKAHKDNLDAALTSWRRNITPAPGPIADARAALDKYLNATLDGGLMGRLFRNGAPLEEINKALKRTGSKFSFQEGNGTAASVAEQVRSWDIPEGQVLQELEKVNAAAQMVEAKQTVGAAASRFGSSTPKPGYVKLSAGDKSELANFIDLTKFYPKEAGEQIQRLDELLGQTTNFAHTHGNLGKFINNVVDPVMSMWKPFMTMARPAHHLRNAWSNIIMNSFAGIHSVQPYRIAKDTLAAAGDLRKTGINGVEALTGSNVVAGSKTAFKYKGQDISYQELYRMANEQGILQSWHVGEDLADNTFSLTHRIMQTKYMKGMGKVSEVNDQFARIAHFADKLMKGSTPFDAAKSVRKYLPDVKGLTPFETKYMRRIFPFYNWIRQAIPVVLETTLIRPGTVNLVPKAEYNAAVALGLDPNVTDMSQPFPDNKLYPSFIRDGIVGPMFGDVGLNLGTPQEAVLGDTLNGNIARNVAGMVTPIIKAPIDLTSRTNIGTGGHVADVTDYVDSQLPIVNQVAGVSGYSVTGLGDPQRQVAIGEKEHFLNAQLVNLFLGLGIQNYGKDSYKTIAGKEAQKQ